MTITEIFDLAKALSPQDRKELAKLLIDTLDTDEPGHEYMIYTPVGSHAAAEILEKMLLEHQAGKTTADEEA